MPSRGRTVRHPSPKEYIRIAVVLAVVTAIEVGIYYAEISRALLIPALLILAAIKFVLVVLWYMHLRFDSRTYARFFMIGLAGAVTLFLLVLLMFRTFSG
jgi:cytochrome c oxidase subunit 4